MTKLNFPKTVPVRPLPDSFRTALSKLRGTDLTDDEWSDLCWHYEWHVGIEAEFPLDRPSKQRDRNKHYTKNRRAMKKAQKDKSLVGGYYAPLELRRPSFVAIARILDEYLDDIEVPTTEKRRLLVIGMLHHARGDVVRDKARPVRSAAWSRPIFYRYEEYQKQQSAIDGTEERYLQLKELEKLSKVDATQMFDEDSFAELAEIEAERAKQRERLTFLATEFRNLFRRKSYKSGK